MKNAPLQALQYSELNEEMRFISMNVLFISNVDLITVGCAPGNISRSTGLDSGQNRVLICIFADALTNELGGVLQ